MWLDKFPYCISFICSQSKKVFWSLIIYWTEFGLNFARFIFFSFQFNWVLRLILRHLNSPVVCTNAISIVRRNGIILFHVKSWTPTRTFVIFYTEIVQRHFGQKHLHFVSVKDSLFTKLPKSPVVFSKLN